jgi:hypothetical protein
MKPRLAGVIALVAGLVPWVFFLGWRANSELLMWLGMLASAPLFVGAAIVHWVCAKYPNRQSVAAWLVAGTMAAVLWTISIFGLLGQME